MFYRVSNTPVLAILYSESWGTKLIFLLFDVKNSATALEALDYWFFVRKIFLKINQVLQNWSYKWWIFLAKGLCYGFLSNKGSLIWYVRKIFRKSNISYPLVRTRVVWLGILPTAAFRISTQIQKLITRPSVGT